MWFGGVEWLDLSWVTQLGSEELGVKPILSAPEPAFNHKAMYLQACGEGGMTKHMNIAWNIISN